jgi:hypothetical protein
MSQELWEDIEGYEGEYAVSTMGRIKSLARNIIYKNGRVCPKKEQFVTPYSKQGYLRIRLTRETKTKHFYVARLVALAFIPKIDGKPEVNHKDRIRTNNCVENLEWADDFMQSRNRDMVLNAKYYYVSEEKKGKSSPWRLRWEVEDQKSKSKYFKTEQDAREWAEQNCRR